MCQFLQLLSQCKNFELTNECSSENVELHCQWPNTFDIENFDVRLTIIV